MTADDGVSECGEPLTDRIDDRLGRAFGRC